MRYSRFLPVAVLAVVVSALVGGLFGSSVAARQDEVSQQYRVFTSALAAIDREYVDDVPSDRLVYSAIDGMLKTLDPHSSFFDPKSYAQMRERQEGKYYGLGIQIQVIDGDITVMSIFEGSPAYKKGLRRGDVIARIAGADAKGWTSEQAVAKLKGPKGTTVNISLRRRGYDGLIDLDVERDEVNIVTVRGAFMIDKETGYIKLGDFSETSDDEVGEALEEADATAGMKRLVFDLRDNPGGAARPGDRDRQPVPAARRHDRLHARPRAELRSGLPRHRSRASTRTCRWSCWSTATAPARRRSSAARCRITIARWSSARRRSARRWCSRSTASASSAGLALTTGRYYTPSGRMIQRPWDGTFDEYLTYSLRDQNAAARAHAGAS